jgi:oligoribonuclease NrnB/cAMP/cGMP phosphodiesterase (DHH superfamily)
MNYGDPIPWDQIHAVEDVIIVDFSLPHEDMLRLSKEKSLTWIDHHKSAIEELSALASSLPGIRDTREAASVLTWRHFHPETEVPHAIVLIGDRDIWRWAEADTGPFNEGLFNEDNRPQNDALWEPLLANDKTALKSLTDKGRVLHENHLLRIKRTINRYGYRINFEGYKTLAINNRGSGEMGQFIREKGYQIAYCYVERMQNGNLTTFVTLYSDEVDVSQIAKKFNGGGHPGAAGFSFTRESAPFPKNAKITLQDE